MKVYLTRNGYATTKKEKMQTKLAKELERDYGSESITIEANGKLVAITWGARNRYSKPGIRYRLASAIEVEE